MRCEALRKGAGVALLLAALVWLNGCSLLRPDPEPPQPPAAELLLTRADEAWLARDFEEARRLYGMTAENFPGDPACQEALLRLSVMEVVLPGDGPDVQGARQWLFRMDEDAVTAGPAASREALLELLDLYISDREAIRMLLEQNRQLEARLAGREREAIRQKASLYQWRLDVDQANERVELLEVELDKIRQEIKLLKDIDMMLQTEGGEPPPPADDQ